LQNDERFVARVLHPRDAAAAIGSLRRRISDLAPPVHASRHDGPRIPEEDRE
jgi:hypothetical protein